MAHTILKEKITPRTISGGILGVLGVFTLIGTTQEKLDTIGLLAAAAGMLTSALGFILTRHWKPPVNPPLTFTAWQLTLGGFATLPMALAIEGVMPPQPATTNLAFAYVGLFASIIAYTYWFTGVTNLPASTVSIIGLLNPLTGLILGIVLAEEILTPLQALGCLAILSGIYIGTRRPRLKSNQQNIE